MRGGGKADTRGKADKERGEHDGTSGASQGPTTSGEGVCRVSVVFLFAPAGCRPEFPTRLRYVTQTRTRMYSSTIARIPSLHERRPKAPKRRRARSCLVVARTQTDRDERVHTAASDALTRPKRRLLSSALCSRTERGAIAPTRSECVGERTHPAHTSHGLRPIQVPQGLVGCGRCC